MVYSCGWLDEAGLTYKDNCHSKDIPKSLSSCRGYHPIAVWAIGTSSFVYPAGIGMPLGIHGHKHILVEVHTKNEHLLKNVPDTSGVRLTYTKTKRPIDGGVMTVGGNTILLPPDTKKTVINRICPSECTDVYLPDDGLNVYAVILHAHTAARKVRADVYRNKQFYKTIANDPYYDYNYQEATWMAEPFKLQRGDDITVTCEFDTTGRKYATSGGAGVYDEMCLVFMFYYPFVPNFTPNQCTSGPANTYIPHLQNQGALPPGDVWSVDKDAFDWGKFNPAMDNMKSDRMWWYYCHGSSESNYRFRVTKFKELPPPAEETYVCTGEGALLSASQRMTGNPVAVLVVGSLLVLVVAMGL
eukprot:GFYU01003403.1.p1 GENE.GFYU01003403.1~~GFYU01003403.1.p1  ORF type:complete len:410 (-),score=113.19 GFYU01003403.1:231-1301(-)